MRKPWLLGVLAVSTSAHAESLSLREAVHRAVEGNRELQKARVVERTAEAQVTAAQGRFDVLSKAGARTGREVTPALSPADANGGATRTLDLNVGFSRNLETGGALSLTLDTSRIATTSRLESGQFIEDASPSATFHSTKLSLNLTHPLWRGLGPEIATAQVRKQRIAASVALLSRQMQAANAVRDVTIAYGELTYATQTVAIARTALQLAQEQLRTTRELVAMGRLTTLDQAAVERAIVQRQQELVLAEQNLFLRSLELRHLWGESISATTPPLEATDALDGTDEALDVAGSIQRALDNNPQLRALRLGAQLSQVDVQMAEDTLHPRLDLVGQLGTTGRRMGWGDSFSQLGQTDNVGWIAGITFEMPLENRTARGQAQAARLTELAANLDAETLALHLRELVVRLVTSARTADTRIDLARREVDFARLNLEAEQARFSVGRATNNDVLLRQQELKDAQIRVVRAQVDLSSAQAALSATSGEILEPNDLGLQGL